jgi:hypothetical protein
MATATRTPTPKDLNRKTAAGKKSTIPNQELMPLDISVENVTADVAREWLELNASNRLPRQRKIVEYARDMLAGKWRPVGDPIRFDTNGDMVDGQHRCMAVVLASEEDPDIEVAFVVVRGVEPEDRVVIDTGTKRTAADQLKMAGYKNHLVLAAAAKWCCMWDRQTLYADAAVKSVTHAEILEYVERNPALIEIAETVSNRMRQHIDMPAGYIAAGYFLCHRVDQGAAFEFFERLTDGAMLVAGDPILALRSRLRDLSRNHANLSGDMWLGLLLRTWNARREERSLRVLPLERAGKAIPAPSELF